MLHGGVNWWFDNGRLVYLQFGGNQPDIATRWNAYANEQASGHPVILEPSYYKYDDPMYQLLKKQWGRFVKSLLEADTVLILTLPPSAMK